MKVCNQANLVSSKRFKCILAKKKLTFQMPADRACELNQQNTDMTLQNKFKETIRFVF